MFVNILLCSSYILWMFLYGPFQLKCLLNIFHHPATLLEIEIKMKQNKISQMETVTDFIFLGSKIAVDGDCSHEIKRRLLLGRKAMIKLDSILKSRDITLPMKIHIVKSEVAQSCPILCDPIDCSLPGSSVHGIFQAIVLEWVAISFSRGSSQPRARTRVSHIVDRRFTIWATREVPI